MYTIALLFILGLIFGIVSAKRSPFSHFVIDSLFSGLVGGCAGVIISMLLWLFVPSHTVNYGPAQLVAIRSADGLNGAFIWGSGSVSSETYYHFYKRNNDGSMTPVSVEANSLVRVAEDPGLIGKGTWITQTCETDLSSPLAKWALVLRSDRSRVISQNFRVPAGTVVHNFNLQ